MSGLCTPSIIKLPKPISERLTAFLIFESVHEKGSDIDLRRPCCGNGNRILTSPFLQTLEKQRTSFSTQFWINFYLAENNERPIDSEAFVKGPSYSAFGSRQDALPPDHRANIVRWMAEACQATHWGLTTFYTAVHAFDTYVLKVPHIISPLSAACLYFGAQLRESTADCNILTLDRFKRLCPEIGTPRTVRYTQAHLIDMLQGSSIGNRTPYDICLLWLSSLGNNAYLYPLYLILRQSGIMRMVYESLIQLSHLCFLNGLNTLIPSTTWIAAALVVTIQSILDCIRLICRNKSHHWSDLVSNFSNVTTAVTTIAQEVCHYPGGLPTLLPFCQWIVPLLTDVFGRIERHLLNEEPLKCYLLQLPSEIASSDFANPNSTKAVECRRKLIKALDEAILVAYRVRLPIRSALYSSLEEEQQEHNNNSTEHRQNGVPTHLSHRTILRRGGIGRLGSDNAGGRLIIPRGLAISSTEERDRKISFHDGLHTEGGTRLSVLIRPNTAPQMPSFENDGMRIQSNSQPPKNREELKTSISEVRRLTMEEGKDGTKRIITRNRASSTSSRSISTTSNMACTRLLRRRHSDILN